MISSVIKLQAPFERLKGYSDCADVNLRRAIILQAIIDATNVSSSKSAVRNADEAKEWLFGDNPYFSKVCNEADLETYTVKQVARDMMDIQQRRYKLAMRKISVTSGNTEITASFDSDNNKVRGKASNDNPPSTHTHKYHA